MTAMSKTSKQSATKKADSGFARSSEEVRHIRKSIQELQEIQRKYAALIIADGPLTSFEIVSEAMSDVVAADEHLPQIEQSLEEFFERPGVDQQILSPTTDNPENKDWASEVAARRAYEWGDIGFKLGLAVGMQLGPHAFDVKGGGDDGPAEDASRSRAGGAVHSGRPCEADARATHATRRDDGNPRGRSHQRAVDTL